jgi:hypothetical protein
MKWQLSHLFIEEHCKFSICFRFHYHEQFYSSVGEKVFKNIGENPAFKTRDFSAIVSSLFKDPASGNIFL